MRFDRKFFSVLLVIAMAMSMLLPVSAAQMEATYGEASYYDIAVEAYSRMLAFHDGVVGAANQNRQYGLITATGEVRVDFQYDGIWYLADNMFSVEQNGRYGMIDTQGSIIEPISHWEITLLVRETGTYLRIDGKYYTADRSLTPVSEDEVYGYDDDQYRDLAQRLGYDWMYPVGFVACNRYIAVKYTSGVGITYYLLDGDNSYSVLLSADWMSEVFFAETFDASLIRIATHDGIYDGNGAVVYDASAHGQRISEEDYYYHSGYGTVIVENTANSLKGLIDMYGDEVIPCEYQRIGNETAAGYIGAVKANNSGFVDSDMYQVDGTLVKTISNTYVATEVYYRHMAFSKSEGGLNGMMDIDGNILIPDQYTSIEVDCSGGNYYDDGSNLLVTKGDPYYGGTYGLYSQDGNVIFADGYESITYLDNNCYKLRDNGRYGVMSTSGRTVIPFDYVDMRVHTTDFIELYDGNRHKIVDLNNKTVVRESIRQIELFRPLYYDLETDLSYAYNRYESWSGALPFCIYTRDQGFATVYADPGTGTTSGELAHRTSNFDLSDPSAVFAYQDDKTDLFGFGRLGESDVIASGYCGKITNQYPEGENLTWKLTSDGTLTISGAGEMADWINTDFLPDSPWDHDTHIKHVVVENGASSVEGYAFYGCDNLSSIILPADLAFIGDSAFGSCSSLTSMTIPDSVTTLRHSVFIGCTNLTSVKLSSGMTAIEEQAFDGCNALRDIYYSGTEEQWNAIPIGEHNDPLLNATIHFLGEPEPEELPEGVKFVPYYYVVEEDSVATGYEVSKSRLPQGLTLDSSSGEIYGVPRESGTFEFTIRRLAAEGEQARSTVITVEDGQLYRQFTFRLNVQNNSNAAVQRPNDYEIIENVGTRDPYDPNSFYMDEYREETFAIDGPYNEFHRLLIDGVEKVKDVDYTVREGSTVITIRAQTFRDVGEGTHTIAAEFRGKDEQGKSTVKQVAQNYTLNLRRPSDNGSNSSGSSSSSNSSESTNYSITVPRIPNCTVKVSPTSASVGTRVTLTVKPYTGYVLSDLTVTGPNGKQVPLTQADGGKYTFRMPEGKVNISAKVEMEQPEPVPAGDTPFLDMLETDWFYSAVVTAYERGWMAGTSDTTFEPYAQTSRGMMVSVLHRIAGRPAASDNAYFSDVPLNQYYASAAAWAAEQGIITGYGDGRFGPSDDLTREQIVMILYNYARLTGMDTAPRSDLTQFIDLEQLSSGAQEAMSWASSVGLINGCGDGTLNPAGTASRAEMAAFLVRFAALAEK